MLQRLRNIVRSFKLDKKQAAQGMLHDSMFSPFEKELGLDNELREVNKRVKVQERVDEVKATLPLGLLIIGFLVYILTRDEETVKVSGLKYRIAKGQILSRIISAKWFRSYLLTAIQDYYSKTTQEIPKCYIKNMYRIMRDDRLEEHELPIFNDTLIKLSHVMIIYEPSIWNMRWTRQTLFQGHMNPKYGQLEYNRHLAEVCWAYGDLEQQYLALLTSPNLSVNDKFLKKFQQNLQSYGQMTNLDDQAMKYKEQILRKQALYIIQNKVPKLQGINLTEDTIDRLLMHSTARASQ